MNVSKPDPAYDIHPGNVTEKVIASFGMQSARESQLLAGLITHLHAFARESQLTHAEWAKAIGFLFRCGEISSAKRDEFVNRRATRSGGAPVFPEWPAGARRSIFSVARQHSVAGLLGLPGDGDHGPF